MPCMCCGTWASRRRSLAVGVRPGAYVFRLHDTGEVIQRFSLSQEHERARRALHPASSRRPARPARRARPAGRSRCGAAQPPGRPASPRAADGVELHFADGTSARGDLLIGADGLKSVVRAPDVRRCARDLHRRCRLARSWCRSNGCRRTCSSRSCRCSWGRTATSSATTCAAARCSISSAASRPTRSPRSPGRSSCRGTSSRRSSAAGIRRCRRSSTPPTRTSAIRWSLFNRPPIRDWSTERVTLLGDAAHPTLPYLAQGAAMSIEDGAVLTRALGMTEVDRRGAADLSAQPRRPHREDRAAVERQPRAVPPAVGGGDQGALLQAGRRRRPQSLALLVQSADGRAEVTRVGYWKRPSGDWPVARRRRDADPAGARHRNADGGRPAAGLGGDELARRRHVASGLRSRGERPHRIVRDVIAAREAVRGGRSSAALRAVFVRCFGRRFRASSRWRGSRRYGGHRGTAGAARAGVAATDCGGGLPAWPRRAGQQRIATGQAARPPERTGNGGRGSAPVAFVRPDLGRRDRHVQSLARHHLDDAVALRLQLAQQFRQRQRGRRLDVVQQQDALALFVEPGARRGGPPRRR